MGWIGVDLDGTLAYYDGKKKHRHDIGGPIPPMLARVKKWLNEGKDVRIVTARFGHTGEDHDLAVTAIQNWCRDHIGRTLPITDRKDFMMEELWDDRAVQVEKNTGIPVTERSKRVI